MCVDKAVELASLSGDFIVILRYLCEVLSASRSAEQAEPLVLEGILIMLHGAPPSVTRSSEFHDIVWSVTPSADHANCPVSVFASLSLYSVVLASGRASGL